jgi:hypothetical protein
LPSEKTPILSPYRQQKKPIMLEVATLFAVSLLLATLLVAALLVTTLLIASLILRELALLAAPVLVLRPASALLNNLSG